jgi:hypothetical protein
MSDDHEEMARRSALIENDPDLREWIDAVEQQVREGTNEPGVDVDDLLAEYRNEEGEYG